MPATILFHFRDGELGDVEEAAHIGRNDLRIVFFGVAREWFGDENAGVVDERIDAPEAGHGFAYHAFGCGRIRDITGNSQDIWIGRWLNGARGRYHFVAEGSEPFHYTCTNALRCASYDDDF